MKKLFIAIAALAAMTSCSQDEVMEVAEKQAISFGGAFVEKATRAIDNASHTSTTLNSFNLYGTVINTNNGNNKVQLWNGVTALGTVGNSTAWTGYADQYWIPNATYYFAAVVDANKVNLDANYMPSTLEYTLAYDNQKDMLYNRVDRTNNTDYSIVKFNFTHLLSKVYFTFNTTLSATGYNYQVSDIKIVSGLATSGVYNCSTNSWNELGADTPKTGTTATDDLLFGNIGATANSDAATNLAATAQDSKFARLIIPGKQTLNIEYTLHTLYNNTEIKSETKTATITDYTFAANTVYKINAEVGGLNKIEFTVNSIAGWSNETNPTPLTPVAVQ